MYHTQTYGGTAESLHVLTISGTSKNQKPPQWGCAGWNSVLHHIIKEKQPHRAEDQCNSYTTSPQTAHTKKTSTESHHPTNHRGCRSAVPRRFALGGYGTLGGDRPVTHL